MAMSMSRTASQNVTLYAAKLERQKRQKFILSRFTYATKEVTEAQAAKGQWPAIPDNAIGVKIPYPGAYTGKGIKGGGDHYEIPMLNALVGQGVSGDTPVIGTGGEDSLDYCPIYVNQKRWEHQLKVGTMPEIREGAWAEQMAQQCGPQLMDLMMRWQAWYAIAYALNYGFSQHIVGAGEGEFAIDERFHPNLCVPGNPQGTGDGYRYTTWSATPATYESALAKNIARVAEGGSDHQMSASLLQKMEGEAEELRLEPLEVGGDELYPCLLHRDQWVQLLQDATFRQSLQNWMAPKNDQAEVYFKSKPAIFSKLAIFVGSFGPSEIYSHKGDGDLTTEVTAGNATKVEFGPLTTACAERDLTTPTIFRHQAGGTSKHLRCKQGWIFGKKAWLGIEARAPKFHVDEWDYENKKGKAISWVGGFARNDSYDSVASPTTVENTSSIPFVTDSPND